MCGDDSSDCCLDTTSHNFVWEIDTLGSYGSYLMDVVIIDENDVWAVGQIKSGYDTTISGNDTFYTPIKYNAVHWDGTE